MKVKFNTRIFNLSAWIIIISTYILPYQNKDEFYTEFGYPFPFFRVYNEMPINTTLYFSFLVKIQELIIDIFIVYIILYFGSIIFQNIKNNLKESQ